MIDPKLRGIYRESVKKLNERRKSSQGSLERTKGLELSPTVIPLGIRPNREPTKVMELNINLPSQGHLTAKEKFEL